MKKRDRAPNPKWLLNYAKQYFGAAEAVYNNASEATAPLNFLYFHTVELLFKSFLRFKGQLVTGGHDIVKLHDASVSQGLTIPGDRYGLVNIVGLLRAGNVDHAFRYGTLKGTSEPVLSWTQEVVGQLLAVVQGYVDPNPSTVPGPVAKATVLFGKPTRKPA